jgi:hypothetical protein
VPFDKGRAGDEGHVVEVDYLSHVSQPAACAVVPGGSLVGATQTLAASLSALHCLSDRNVPSYTPILGDWYNRELCRESDGTPPERGHGSPNACMVKKKKKRRRGGCDAAYGRITGAASVRQGSCDKEAGVFENGVKVCIRRRCHSLPAAPPSFHHHAMSVYVRLSTP